MKLNREKTWMMLTVALLVAAGVEGYFLSRNHDRQAVGPAILFPSPGSKDPADISSRDWNPFEELDRMQQEMNRMFNRSFNHFSAFPDFDRFGMTPFSPETDIKDAGDHYEIRMNVPGADEQHIDVKVEDGMLTVSGSSDVQSRRGRSGMLWQERRTGRFSRTFSLPGPVREEDMDVKYKRGVLTITLPKADGDA